MTWDTPTAKPPQFPVSSQPPATHGRPVRSSHRPLLAIVLIAALTLTLAVNTLGILHWRDLRDQSDVLRQEITQTSNDLDQT